MATPGFRELVTWINVELNLQAYDPDAAKRVRHELARRLNSPFHEIDDMSLVDAAAVLTRPEYPALVRATNAEKGTRSAARAGSLSVAVDPTLHPLLHSLAELRSRFAARIDDDLNFLQITGHIALDTLKRYQEDFVFAAFEKAEDDPIALPSDDDLFWGEEGCREGADYPITANPSGQNHFFASAPESREKPTSSGWLKTSRSTLASIAITHDTFYSGQRTGVRRRL